jgi:hypothetical protein
MPGRPTPLTLATAARDADRFDLALTLAGAGVDRPRLASPAMTCTRLALALLPVALAGCGGSSPSTAATESSPPGDIPDNQAFVAYSPPSADYSVKVPEGWARTAAGGAVTFTDKLNAIRMQEGAAKARSVSALAKQVKGASQGKVSIVRRSAGPAVRVAYLAPGKPDPVTGKTRTDAIERYVFVHRGKQVVLTLSGPEGADNVDPWKLVTDSLRWSR